MTDTLVAEPEVADVPPPAPPEPPAAPTGPGETALVLVAPWQVTEFISGIDGWDPITHAGTAGPSATADQVIAAGVLSDVTIESR